jgi:hypothetical protein
VSERPSSPLPPYRGVIAVDTVRFTRNPSSRQPDLSAAVQDALASASDRCGHREIWEQRRFPQSTGDGYLLGVLPEVLPFLIHPFLDSLHEVLHETDESLRAKDRRLRLRLRVSINVGPVPDSGEKRTDRIGDPTNTTFRLLDSTALRDALERSNPDVTLLAAIISQRVFDDVIRAEYAPAVHPDRLEQVTAEVPGKDFAEPAWIYVPRPSRLPAGPGRSDSAPIVEAPASGQSVKEYRNVGQQINADQLHGDITYQGRDA